MSDCHKCEMSPDQYDATMLPIKASNVKREFAYMKCRSLVSMLLRSNGSMYVIW